MSPRARPRTLIASGDLDWPHEVFKFDRIRWEVHSNGRVILRAETIRNDVRHRNEAMLSANQIMQSVIGPSVVFCLKLRRMAVDSFPLEFMPNLVELGDPRTLPMPPELLAAVARVASYPALRPV